jgi:3-hydroxybenzoate 6-monooxygenase
MHDRLPAPRWSNGRVSMLGDAAHPMLQYLAQAARVQRTPRTWGDIWHVDGLAMALRDEAFRLRPPVDLSRIDWLYGDSAA